MDLTAPGLRNERVSLEPLTERFREALRQTQAVDFMWQSMPAIPRGASFDTYYDYTLRSAQDKTHVPFAILDANRNNAFSGVIAFIEPNRIHRNIGIGYTWLSPDLRGHGVYPGIQALMIQRALDWGAKRIVWKVESANTVAIKAIRALGAIQEGVLRQHQRFANGQWADMVVLSMLRDEAKQAVARLGRMTSTTNT